MKALIIFAKLALAATVLAGSANAQMKILPGDVAEHIGAAATKETIIPVKMMDSTGTIIPIGTIVPNAVAQPIVTLEIMADSISPESSREATVQGMTRVIAQLVKDHAPGSTQMLRSGKAIDLTAMIDTERSVAAWHSVNVKASYDARPIGGILNIRVGLAPVFGGVGSAVRSVDYREFAEAVDSFDDDFVAKTISRLSKELAAEYTAKK